MVEGLIVPGKRGYLGHYSTANMPGSIVPKPAIDGSPQGSLSRGAGLQLGNPPSGTPITGGSE